MKGTISLIVIMVMLVMTGTAIAQEMTNPCGFILSQTKNETEEGYYINPREISHLTTVYDKTSTAVGQSGRYILGVTMTNGEVLRYGSYTTSSLRLNIIYYITQKVIQCNAK